MQRYDAKVHRACRDMSDAALGELKAIGIPFFGTRPELVQANSEIKTTSTDMDYASDNKIPTEELRKLQKKILELLEDMCRD